MNISDEILKSIEIMIDSKLKKLDFDKTYIGIISSVNTDGYTVKYNGTEINIKTNATDVFKKGDMVNFCIPCGNRRNAFLLSKIANFENVELQSLTASAIKYDNSVSGLKQQNVNDVIDELLTQINEVKKLIVPISRIDDSVIDKMFENQGGT